MPDCELGDLLTMVQRLCCLHYRPGNQRNYGRPRGLLHNQWLIVSTASPRLCSCMLTETKPNHLAKPSHAGYQAPYSQVAYIRLGYSSERPNHRCC